MIWAALYLIAIIAANLSVALFGPASTPFNAFLLIGATLTLRDKLHDKYGVRIVQVLIFVGGGLSMAFGGNIVRIALAGVIAFVLSELVDTAVYHQLRFEEWLKRSNTSNIFGAVVDSAVFPMLAFGGFPWIIMLAQFAAKVAGGFMWSALINRYRKKPCQHKNVVECTDPECGCPGYCADCGCVV